MSYQKGLRKIGLANKRAKIWSDYYDSKKKIKLPNDWVHKDCLECGEEMILEYKRREMKFCSRGCASTHNNKKRWEKIKPEDRNGRGLT